MANGGRKDSFGRTGALSVLNANEASSAPCLLTRHLRDRAREIVGEAGDSQPTSRPGSGGPSPLFGKRHSEREGRFDSSLRAASSMVMSSTSSSLCGMEDSLSASAKLEQIKRPLNSRRQSRGPSPEAGTMSTTSTRFSDRGLSSNASCTSNSPMSAFTSTPRQDFCMDDKQSKRLPVTSAEWLSSVNSPKSPKSPKSPVVQAGSNMCREAPAQTREPTGIRFQPPQVGATCTAGAKDNYTPLAKRAGRGKDMSKLTIQTQPAKDFTKKRIRKLEEDEKIFDIYYWEEVLQETGDGGKVVVCEPKDGGKTPKLKKDKFRFVMKMRSKKDLKESGLLADFQKLQERLMNLPRHSNVLVPHEVLEDDNFYYVVMEKASYACFFSGLLALHQDGNMPPSAIRKLMKEILGAVSHVHKEGMLHRDIKPDNLVVHEDPKSPTGKKVMLIDFDHADHDYGPQSPKYQNAVFGTARFNSPEAFQGCFSVQSDLYAVGCILYLLITGKMPHDDSLFEFKEDSNDGRCSAAILKRLQKAKIDFDCSPFPEETSCRDFCQSLLAFKPEDRPVSAEQALKHPWFEQKDADS